MMPVGRDCDCGHPLVWSHGRMRCAVFGSHPPLFGSLVDLCDRTPIQLQPGEHHRLRPGKRPT